MEKPLREYSSVQRWLNRLASKESGSDQTPILYLQHFNDFIEFAKMNPDEIIQKWDSDSTKDLKKALYEWDMWLDDFVTWLTKTKGKKKSTSSIEHAVVRSFIKYNSMVKLTIASPKVGVVEPYRPISLEEFKTLYNTAGPFDRWILCGFKDSGMSREDFVRLTYGDVKDQLAKGEEYIHLRVYRQKTQARYETFLGPNAVAALKIYLRLREHRGEKLIDASRLTELKAKSITLRLLDFGKRVGIETSPHRLRKTFETYMGLTVHHPVILKYWMGHMLFGSDVESRYLIPPEPEQRHLYQEAYKNLDITQASVEERVKAMEKFLETMSPEQKEIAQRYGLRWYHKKGEGEEPEEPKRETNGGQRIKNGNGHEQRKVSEADLTNISGKAGLQGWFCRAGTS